MQILTGLALAENMSSESESDIFRAFFLGAGLFVALSPFSAFFLGAATIIVKVA